MRAALRRSASCPSRTLSIFALPFPCPFTETVALQQRMAMRLWFAVGSCCAAHNVYLDEGERRTSLIQTFYNELQRPFGWPHYGWPELLPPAFFCQSTSRTPNLRILDVKRYFDALARIISDVHCVNGNHTLKHFSLDSLNRHALTLRTRIVHDFVSRLIRRGIRSRRGREDGWSIGCIADFAA